MNLTKAARKAVKAHAKHGKTHTIQVLQQSTGVSQAKARKAVEAVHRTLTRQVLSS